MKGCAIIIYYVFKIDEQAEIRLELPAIHASGRGLFCRAKPYPSRCIL